MSESAAPRPRGTSLRAAIGGRLAPGSLSRSTLIVLVFAGCAAVLGTLRDVILARRLGLGLDVDAWALGLALMGYVSSALRGSVESMGVPLIINESLRAEDASGNEAGIHVVLISLFLGCLIGLLSLLFSPQIAVLLAGRDRELREVLEPVIVLLGGLSVIVVIAASGARAVLQASRRYALTSAGPMISSATVVIAVLATPNITARSAAGWFTFALIIEAAIIGAVAVRQCQPITVEFRSLSGTTRLLLPRVLSMSAASAAFGTMPLVDLWFASRLGRGEAGALAIAGRIPLGIAALLAGALAMPILTELSVVLNRDGPIEMRVFLVSRLRRIGVIAALISAGIAIASVPLALVLYRGDEMTRDSALRIGLIQVIYCLSVVPYTLGVVMSRAHQAMSATSVLLRIGLAGLLANIAADALGALLFGAAGIAAATAIVYSLTGMLLWRCLKREQRVTAGETERSW